MTRFTEQVRDAAHRLVVEKKAPNPKMFLGTPARALKFTPGWARKLVKSRRDDGTHLDRDEARATLKGEPYAKLLRYVGGSRDGIWFEWDPKKVKP